MTDEQRQDLELDVDIVVVDRWQLIIQGDSDGMTHELAVLEAAREFAKKLGADSLNGTFATIEGGNLLLDGDGDEELEVEHFDEMEDGRVVNDG